MPGTIQAAPISISPDAAARVAELGMRAELDRMIEHAQEAIPDLRKLRVILEPDPEGIIDPGIVLWAHRPNLGSMSDTAENDWAHWLVSTFPPRGLPAFLSSFSL